MDEILRQVNERVASAGLKLTPKKITQVDEELEELVNSRTK